MADTFSPMAIMPPRYSDEETIGLPANAMVITNSERKETFCPKKWWFSRAVGLVSPPNKAILFGGLFDTAMEQMLNFYRMYPDRLYTINGLYECPGCIGEDCGSCLGTGLGAFSNLDFDGCVQPDTDIDELNDLFKRLEKALQGWLIQYDESMKDDYNVISAQVQIAAPITDQNGNVFESYVPVVKDEQGWVLANGLDEAQKEWIKMPWYQICKLDGLVEDKRTKKLLIWETKTSGNPQRFSQDLPLDTQLPGYLRSLWYVTQVLGEFGGRQPDGWVWDVTSSELQNEPKILKNGLVSMAKNQRVPSWKWQACIDKLKSNGDLDKQKDVSLLLSKVSEARMTTDKKLYHRLRGNHTPLRLREYEAELFSDAIKISEWLSRMLNTARIEDACDQSAFNVALHFPRQPICRNAGGFCAYKGICQQDSASGRSYYEPRQRLRWLHNAASAANNTPTE